MNESHKIAWVRLSESEQYWEVVECPYCGLEHRHGAPLLGLRCSHCSSGEYELVPLNTNSPEATDERMDIISGRKEADT